MDTPVLSRRAACGGDEEFWRLAVALQRGCGLSMAEFCRREGLVAKTFYKWRDRLAQRDAWHGRLGSTQEIALADKVAAASFVPVRLLEDDAGRPSDGAALSLKASSRPRLPELASNQGQAKVAAGAAALPDGVGSLEVRTELANERVVIIRTPIHQQALTTVLASLEALEC